MDSGQLRIEIRSFSAGSVVVNFTVIFTTGQTQAISSVASALLSSLINSSIYTVDRDSVSINGNFLLFKMTCFMETGQLVRNDLKIVLKYFK